MADGPDQNTAEPDSQVRSQGSSTKADGLVVADAGVDSCSPTESPKHSVILDELAETIRREHDASSLHRAGAITHDLAIGKAINTARGLCGSNIAYGRWLREAKLPFLSTEWARQLGILAANKEFAREWWVEQQLAGREPTTTGACAAIRAASKAATPRPAFASPLANDYPESDRRTWVSKNLARTWARGDRVIRLANEDERTHREWEEVQRDFFLEVLAPHVHADYDRDVVENVLDEILAVLRGE